MTELPRQSYFVRPGEPLMEAAERVAIDMMAVRQLGPGRVGQLEHEARRELDG